ncbi:MAG: right-handed parallel beta-helix repeat-containing protein [Verrucomicrobiota bacterium]
MNSIRLLHCVFAFVFVAGVANAQTVIEPAPGRFFVAANGKDEWSGKLVTPNPGGTDGPFATLARGQKAMRAETLKSTLYVRGGNYYLTEPLVLTPADSGTTYTAYPGERPVISGGRPIIGWQKANDNLWSAAVPEARGGRWNFSQLRVGHELQTKARFPNADPANPLTGGWLYMAGEDKKVGAFGSFLSRIHNTNDTVTWTFNAPMEGQYKVAFYYSAFNRPLGYATLDGRMTVQAGAGQPVELRNLNDTGALNVFRWATVGAVHLDQGQQYLRWVNTKGGALNLDAIVLCDDPNWNPGGPVLPRNAPGSNLIVVQAEVFNAATCKEMVVPNMSAAAFRNRFQFRQGDLKAYPRSPGFEIVAFPDAGLASAVLTVRGVDYNSRVVQVEENSNAALPLRAGNRFYVSHVLEELDTPGEWFLDRIKGEMFLWPKQGNPGLQDVVAPVLDHLIEFKGDVAKNQFVEQVKILGFLFCDTIPSRTVQVFAPVDAAIWMSGARQCVIEGNRFINLAGNAVRLENKSAQNEIVGNEIAYNGQGGVALVGTAANQPVQNVIEGNWMHHLGLAYKHSPGVLCDSGGGTRIAHNLFEDLPRAAISLRSRDGSTYSHNTTVEFNDIRRVCLETPDTGAIEVIGRHRREMSTTIQNNRIHDVVGLSASSDGKLTTPANTWGIYLDDFSSGVTVRGNLIARATTCLGISGGRNNVIDNNVFLEAGSHLFGIEMGDAFGVSNRIVRNIFVCHTPNIELFHVTGTWRGQFFGECNNNVFWHTQGAGYLNERPVTPYGPLSKWKAVKLDAASVVADPMFIGSLEAGLQINPGSPAVKLGFQPIPSEKIGLAGSQRAWKKN